MCRLGITVLGLVGLLLTDRVAIKPALALGGWVAFVPASSGAMFMGDLVLTDTELSPVMARLIEITADEIMGYKGTVNGGVYQFSAPRAEAISEGGMAIDDSPHLLFMHFWANDEAQKLAQGLRAALDLANLKRGS